MTFAGNRVETPVPIFRSGTLRSTYASIKSNADAKECQKTTTISLAFSIFSLADRVKRKRLVAASVVSSVN